MATLASVFGRIFPRGVETDEDLAQAGDQAARLRPFANEDIYLYVKRIDNSRVVREQDPAAGEACWKLVGSVGAAAVLLIFVLMPGAYGLLAGYQIQSLQQEGQRLAAESAALELQEAELLSPARMEELARVQRFVDPAPEKVVYLENDTGAEVAAVAAGDRGGAR